MKKNWIIALLAVYGMAATVLLVKRPLFPPPGMFGATEERATDVDASAQTAPLALAAPPPVEVAKVAEAAEVDPEEPVESPLADVVRATGPADAPVVPPPTFVPLVPPTGAVAPSVAQTERSEVLTIFSNTFGQVSNMVWDLTEGPGATAMNETMRLEGRQRAARRYGDFLSRFELTYDQRQDALNALALGEAPPGAGPGGGNDEADKEAIRAALREQLGEDGLAMFDVYEQTVAGRDAVRTLGESLGEHLALSVEQRDTLIPLMNGAAMLRDSMGVESLGMADLSQPPPNPEQELNDLQTRYNDVLRGAASALSQEQLNALSGHLQNQMEMAEAETKVRSNLRERLGGLKALQERFDGGGDGEGAGEGGIQFEFRMQRSE